MVDKISLKNALSTLITKYKLRQLELRQERDDKRGTPEVTKLSLRIDECERYTKELEGLAEHAHGEEGEVEVPAAAGIPATE